MSPSSRCCLSWSWLIWTNKEDFLTQFCGCVADHLVRTRPGNHPTWFMVNSSSAAGAHRWQSQVREIDTTRPLARFHRRKTWQESCGATDAQQPRGCVCNEETNAEAVHHPRRMSKVSVGRDRSREDWELCLLSSPSPQAPKNHTTKEGGRDLSSNEEGGAWALGHREVPANGDHTTTSHSRVGAVRSGPQIRCASTSCFFFHQFTWMISKWREKQLRTSGKCNE